ncbi:MAG: hypothetical protein VB957_04955 [Pseudomonadales bacterium]
MNNDLLIGTAHLEDLQYLAEISVHPDYGRRGRGTRSHPTSINRPPNLGK